MTPSMVPDDLEIAPGFTVGCWKTLTLDPGTSDSSDWKRAFQIFDARIRCRFFDPVDELIKCDQQRPRKTFGFAILAIDFLVIETLQGFYDGTPNHNGKSKELFTKFLTRWDTFEKCVPTSGDPKQLAEQVYRNYRCALHHSGATDGAFRVGVSGPVFAFKSGHEVKINRTLLHANLKCEFAAYLRELRVQEGKELRCRFKRKMDAICGLQTAERPSELDAATNSG